MDSHRTSEAYRIRSGDYQSAAEAMIALQRASKIRISSDDPIDMLVGHAFELALKSLLLRSGITTKRPEAFRHDIAKLYRFLRKNTSLLVEVETLVETKWIEELLEQRSRYLESLQECAAFQDVHNMPTEEEIRGQRFELYSGVCWYSEHMTTGGNLYRYYQDRREHGNSWDFAGKAYNGPRQSLLWATRCLNS